MRLFVGVELSDALKEAAGSAADSLRERMSRAAPHASLRWVPPANLHITLWFLGELSDARADVVAGVLASPLRTPAFRLGIGGGGAFPPSGLPRALWLGLTAGRDSLVDVHAEIATRFSDLGIAPETRPYSPHLTIARVKDLLRRDAAAVRSVMATAPPEPGGCAVAEVTLFRSRPSAKGSQYETVLRVPLE